MIREILKMGDPRLLGIARPVDHFDTPELHALIADMFDTMHAANGAGLAAPQIGVPLRLFVVEVRDNPRYPYKPPIPLRVVANPELRPVGEETFPSYEGCLSVPDLRGLVLRRASVEVEYLDLEGRRVVERVRGLSAGTFQHELDHLDGVLFLDRVEDTRTLTTWEGFRRHHEHDWLETVAGQIAGASLERSDDEGGSDGGH
jgi:peptide deformylase